MIRFVASVIAAVVLVMVLAVSGALPIVDNAAACDPSIERC